MSDLRETRREPLHQPPNPADVRRAPPLTSACAIVRGWLRDFVDGDLDAAERGRVEEHVHTCRVCAVELARAEHEVLRLRRAFGTSEGVVAPASGFAARVVQRLVIDETSLLSRESLATVASIQANQAKSPTQADGGAAVGAGSSTGPGGAGGARRSFGLHAGQWFVGTLLLLVSVAALVVLLDGDVREPERQARLVVTSAANAYGDFGDGRLRLTSGDDLGDDQTLWVGVRGAAQLDWHDASRRAQPAAHLHVDGLGELRMQDGEPVFVLGNLHVESRRPVSIPVADGSRLELGVGEYLISIDAEAARRGNADPLGKAAEDLRIGIEVVRGDAAEVLRRETGPALVQAGQSGVYRGSSPVEVRPSPRAGETGPGLGRQPGEAPMPPAATLVGHVYERSGAPGQAVDVVMSYVAGGVRHTGVDVTAFDGSFRVGANSQGLGDFAILMMTPPANRMELGLTAPDAYRVLSHGSEGRLAGGLVLDYSEALQGVVVDEQEQAQLGVRVVPCVVDELFGPLFPWLEGQATTDGLGRFRIHRLPVHLPHHQHLALLLLHPELEPTVVPVPARGSLAARSALGPLVAPTLRSVRVHGLTANWNYQIWEDVVGLPPGSAAVVRSVRSDGQGQVNDLRVGRGQLWLHANTSPLHPRVRAMVLDDLTGTPRYRAGNDPPRARNEIFRENMAAVPGTDLLLSHSFRHSDFATTRIAPAPGDLLVVDGMTLRMVAGAQAFLVEPTGVRGSAKVRFLGLTADNGTLQADLDGSVGGVFVIGSDGSTGWLPQSQIHSVNPMLALQSCGRVLVDASLRPQGGSLSDVVTIRFERSDGLLAGMAPVAARFACAASGWEVSGLPAGEYRAVIGERTFSVEVPPSGFVVLR